MENIKSVVEAIIFAAGDGIAKSYIIEKIPELTSSKLNGILADLKKKYSGDCGIMLLEFNGNVQFSSNTIYGDQVAEILTPLKEKELTKALLEVLATIAYKQPITKLELDEIRGVSNEYALAGLAKAKLIKVVGRRDTVGRPLLYGTTDEFLKKFELETLEDLPDMIEVMEKVQLIYQPPQDSNLFHSRTFLGEDENEEIDNGIPHDLFDALKVREAELADVEFENNEIAADIDNDEEEDEVPDFLADEEFKVYE